MKFLDLINRNRKLLKIDNFKKKIKINILSNITCDPIKEHLFYYFLKNYIKADISFSEYNNFTTLEKKNFDLNIIFLDFLNIIEGIHYKINFLSKNNLKKLISDTKEKINLIIKNIPDDQIVVFNKLFNPFDENISINSNSEIFINEINNHIAKCLGKNLILIDISKIILTFGLKNTFSIRDFYLSKSLYKFKFYEKYAVNLDQKSK